MSDLVAYELRQKMVIGDTIYNNLQIISEELIDKISSINLIGEYARMMDHEILKTCGQVLPTREWTCRPLTLWQMMSDR